MTDLPPIGNPARSALAVVDVRAQRGLSFAGPRRATISLR